MGKFTITKRKNDEFQFNLEDEHAKVILTSEGYTSKASCKNGIESVKSNASFDSRYAREIAINGKYYFNLKAGNGEIIGTSQMYATIFDRENGIEWVKNNAPYTIIVDETL